MVVLGRLLRTAKAWRSIPSPKTLTLAPPRSRRRDLPRGVYHQGGEQLSHSRASDFGPSRLVPDAWGPYSIFPAVLAGFFGVGLLEISHADGDKAAVKPPLPSESSPKHVDWVETAKKERQKIEELLLRKRMAYGSYPRFTVAVEGQKVAIKFQIPPACEISQLIANLVSHLGLEVEERGGGSHMLLGAWDSSFAWQLTLTYPEKKEEVEADGENSKNISACDSKLCVVIYGSLISPEKAEMEFIKPGSFSAKELYALVSILELAGGMLGQKKTLERKPREGTMIVSSAGESLAFLNYIGVRIYGLGKARHFSSNSEMSWDNMAGYDQQKREIEDTVLLALHCPKIYDDIARGTRRKFESNRPRAVLFEGPPGTGKTSCARVIANQAGVLVLYVPLEMVMSEDPGVSKLQLRKVFSLANRLPKGSIIFLDEIDCLSVTEMREATRGSLAVLLQQDRKVVVIAATNRKQDLDPALISRFDSVITFGLPDQQNREEIAAQYAKHLTKPELEQFARVTEEMSGRDIRVYVNKLSGRGHQR